MAFGSMVVVEADAFGSVGVEVVVVVLEEVLVEDGYVHVPSKP